MNCDGISCATPEPEPHKRVQSYIKCAPAVGRRGFAMVTDKNPPEGGLIGPPPSTDFGSLWSSQQNSAFPTIKFGYARSYDVIIVGAGINGALVAETLCDGTRTMLIVDRRAPASGGTSASTALIQHEIDTPLSTLNDAIGEDRASAFWHRSANAVERLCQRVSDLHIACGLERKHTLYLAGTELDADGMANEAEARNRTGIRAHFLRADCLKDQYGISRPGAIVSEISASANPVQLALGLLKEVSQRGGVIASPVEIIDVIPSGGRVHLLTTSGDYLSAAQVIFCTGCEFPSALTDIDHTAASTWAVATAPNAPVPDWMHRTLVWEASDPYLYIRLTPDGRLVAGGEDEEGGHAFRSEGKHHEKSHLILEKVSGLLNVDVGPAEFRWSGNFGKTPSGLPHIGAVPGLPHVYACIGFGGNGMTFSMIAADLLKAELNGRSDPDASLFAFPDGEHGRLSA